MSPSMSPSMSRHCLENFTSRCTNYATVLWPTTVATTAGSHHAMHSACAMHNPETWSILRTVCMHKEYQ